MPFEPAFSITSKVAASLMRIEAARQAVQDLPITPSALALDQSVALRRLDPRQRKALELFRQSTVITSRDVEALFGVSQRASRNLLTAWVDNGFVVVADPAKKTRKYGLSSDFTAALQ